MNLPDAQRPIATIVFQYFQNRVQKRLFRCGDFVSSPDIVRIDRRKADAAHSVFLQARVDDLLMRVFGIELDYRLVDQVAGALYPLRIHLDEEFDEFLRVFRSGDRRNLDRHLWGAAIMAAIWRRCPLMM